MVKDSQLLGVLDLDSGMSLTMISWIRVFRKFVALLIDKTNWDFKMFGVKN